MGRSFFWLFAEQNESDLAVRGIRLAEHEQLQRAAREIQSLRDCAVDLLATFATYTGFFHWA